MAVKDEHKQKVAGGAEHVLYKGLLAMAHEKWGTDWSMEAKIIQFPSDANNQTTIASATVILPDEQTFVEIGDANPQNVGRTIVPHAIRMAATRAKGRALRDALNIGEALAEEFDEGSSQQSRQTSGRQSGNQQGQQQGGGNVQQMRGAATKAKAPRKDAPKKQELDELKSLIAEEYGDRGLAAWEQKRKPFAEMNRTEVLEAIEELTPAPEVPDDEVEIDEDDLEEIEEMSG